MRALSYTFIWQPQVMTCRRFGSVIGNASLDPAGPGRERGETSASDKGGSSAKRVGSLLKLKGIVADGAVGLSSATSYRHQANAGAGAGAGDVSPIVIGRAGRFCRSVAAPSATAFQVASASALRLGKAIGSSGVCSSTVARRPRCCARRQKWV